MLSTVFDDFFSTPGAISGDCKKPQENKGIQEGPLWKRREIHAFGVKFTHGKRKAESLSLKAEEREMKAEQEKLRTRSSRPPLSAFGLHLLALSFQPFPSHPSSS